MAKIVTLHAVWQGEDERGCGGSPAWYFEQKSMADHVAKGRGSWGSNARIIEVKAIELDGKYYALKSDKPITINVGPEEIKEMKKKALEKLDPAERELLGLKDFKV